MTEKLTLAVVILAGIGGIIFLEIEALRQGVDGVALSASISGITVLAAGFGGFKIRDIWRK